MEATTCNVSAAHGGESEKAQFQCHLEQLARKPELLTFLVMVPESATVRVLHLPFDYRAPFNSESTEWDR